MSGERVFSFMSLAVALTALGHSLWLQSRAGILAREALQRREAELVQIAAPRVAEIMENMGSKPFDAAAFKPVTLEELGRPLVKIITNFTGPELVEPSSEKPLPPN